MKLANFPILIPAFTAQISIDAPLAITRDLLAIPFHTTSGHLVSEASYPYTIRASFLHGVDYLSRDRDGQHVRLDVRSVARDERSGALIKFEYNGIVDVTGEIEKILSGDVNASTTGFGNACEFRKFFAIPAEMNRSVQSDRPRLMMVAAFLGEVVQVKFDTQHPAWQEIGNKLYVGSGRFVVRKRKPIVVEYKISEVAAACVHDTPKHAQFDRRISRRPRQ